MSGPIDNNGGLSSDEMSDYLQLFLDETEEQLDDLVESLLVLETNPDSANELNEAFRMVHSIKGAAGMMGFDKIMILTHQLENRFQRFRSGTSRLDQSTMNLILRCIDFLRECNARLRTGEPLGSSAELLGELQQLEDRDEKEQEGKVQDGAAAGQTTLGATAEDAPPAHTTAAMETVELETPSSAVEMPDSARQLRIKITFVPGLALAELKARLIASRLSKCGEIKSTVPTQAELETASELSHFTVVIDSNSSTQQLREAADVDGVSSIECDDGTTGAALEPTSQPGTRQIGDPLIADEPTDETVPKVEARALEARENGPSAESSAGECNRSTAADPTGKAKVAETMRVDIDRLENLMNLAGELVINRARFVQVADQLRPALRKTNDVGRVREFVDSVRRTIAGVEKSDGEHGESTLQIRDLETGLEFLEQHLKLWETSRRSIGQVNEAIDQLTRVSDSLQRGVMETRMVPVAPLFNRFKRVVRDLAVERGKRVDLRVSGEKTELDKRMIDELGDPLMHLVRNCVDHGLEQPEVRAGRGKPEVGTVFLAASHSGNNIHIQVRDDGGGINVEKIRNRLVEQRILTAAELGELSDAQIADFIWHPGLSTAAEITDISGRGVGMDVVNSRISSLNGSIELQSVPERGTTFTIRLPLTLAIINSLLVRVHSVIFSIPIDDVREIVSVHRRDIVTIQGKQTFDIRGEFIPLVQIEDVFTWRELDDKPGNTEERSAVDDEPAEVVIIHAGHRTLGLRVAELVGSQDIVIKSLAENLVHIRGLSGASILGDGTVCLMLDVGAVLNVVFGK